MSYIVKVGSDYIADGNNYTVQGESFVPFTGRFTDAKKYKNLQNGRKRCKKTW